MTPKWFRIKALANSKKLGELNPLRTKTAKRDRGGKPDQIAIILLQTHREGKTFEKLGLDPEKVYTTINPNNRAEMHRPVLALLEILQRKRRPYSLNALRLRLLTQGLTLPPHPQFSEKVIMPLVDLGIIHRRGEGAKVKLHFVEESLEHCRITARQTNETTK